MMNKTNLKITFAALAVLLMSSSCGKKDDQQAAPAPSAPVAPVAPAPPPPPPAVPGTNCPVVAGTMPLSQNGSLFYGNLQGQQQNNYYGTSSNSLTLNVQLTNYTGYTTPIQNVVASGNLYLPDLATLNRYPVASQNFNVCVSTNTVANGAPAIPGTYNIQNNGAVQMILQGTIQIPTAPTYGPQTGAPTFTTDTIQVFVGQDCPAYLSSTGRIYGCVTVQIGNPGYGGPVLRYQSR